MIGRVKDRITDRLRLLARALRRGRRASIAVMFAVSAIPLTIGVGVAVDFSRLAAARSAMQRAVDNAALSGAAAYVLYTQGDTFHARALSVATSAFCNAVTALPDGAAVVATGGGASCRGSPGPAVSAVIAGYNAGTRGVVPSSGCSSTQTVVSGASCGFVVTVAATAQMTTVMPLLSGTTMTIGVTASAANPFIDLGVAITPIFHGSARYTDSLWVYPLLLDANGSPDFTANAGALPDTSACTGNPDQASCGNYVMLASTAHVACTSASPCTVGGAVFGGNGGVVQNPAFGSAVVTATTPLGIAIEASAGAPTAYPYNTGNPHPADGCTWPATVDYNTISQAYDAGGNPLVVDATGRWVLPTHWLYSSFLANGRPPDQNEIDLQNNTAINPVTGLAYNIQVVPAVPTVSGGVATPAHCNNPNAHANNEYFATTYRTTGATNCALYIVEDPATLTPDPSLKVGFGQAPNCFTPAGTPGYQYAALSCANYAGHNFVFFWNDQGGGVFDDTDYGNGTLEISCSGPSNVVLIN